MSRSVSEVSVITVNWNGRQHLEHLIPSLVPLSPKEIIVVDNGSTDDSVDFLRKTHPDVRLLTNPTNQGFCQPNNLAAEEATGETLAFINNDMRADRNWLTCGLEPLEGDAVCVGSRILNWDGSRIDFNGSSLQYLGFALQKDIGSLVEEVSASENILFPCGGSMLIDRRTFIETGGFDEDFFAVYEDVDLGWRLWALGYRVVFAPESVTYHRAHSTFETQPNEKLRYLMHRNALLTIFKNYEDKHLRRLLPLAVILNIKRAIRCSGVRKESFYLWESVKSRLKRGDQNSYLEVTDCLTQLAALDDFLELLPEMSRKRTLIQERRRREDRKILSLFSDPLRPIVEDARYINEEVDYFDYLGLEELLDEDRTRAYAGKAREFNSPRAITSSELKDELKALQWLAGRAQISPPLPSKFQKFRQIWQDHGFKEALKMVVQKLKDGR